MNIIQIRHMFRLYVMYCKRQQFSNANPLRDQLKEAGYDILFMGSQWILKDKYNVIDAVPTGR